MYLRILLWSLISLFTISAQYPWRCTMWNECPGSVFKVATPILISIWKELVDLSPSKNYQQLTLMLYDLIRLKFRKLKFSVNFNHFKIMFFSATVYGTICQTWNDMVLPTQAPIAIVNVKEWKSFTCWLVLVTGKLSEEAHLHQTRILKIYKNTYSSNFFAKIDWSVSIQWVPYN